MAAGQPTGASIGKPMRSGIHDCVAVGLSRPDIVDRDVQLQPLTAMPSFFLWPRRPTAFRLRPSGSNT